MLIICFEDFYKRQTFQKGGDTMADDKYMEILAAMAERSNKRMTILIAVMAALAALALFKRT